MLKLHTLSKIGPLAGAALLAGSALALGACFWLTPNRSADPGSDCQPVGGCDFFVNVDRSADAGASYSTIGAAVAAARCASCATSPTVHVGPGTYSTATGETFPIEARGVSIVGAGQDMTTVTGAGVVKVGLPGNAQGSLSNGGAVTGTFLVGDSTAQTSIADLSIDVPTHDGGAPLTFEGIVCDRGNASATPPAPNTSIDGVTIRGFDAAVRVTWSRDPGIASGCNARIVRSTLRDGWFGVIADGEGLVSTPKQLVSLELGDSAADGNKLLNFHFSNSRLILIGAGLVIGDGVTGAVVRGNTFAQEPGALGDFGIWIVQQDYDPVGIDIEDNTVGPLLNEGVGLMGRVAVKAFLHNTVQGVSMQSEPQHGWLGVGLAVGLEGFEGIPFVALARHNTFVGNDVGVEFRSTTDALPDDPSAQNDFGRVTSPGHNVFQCNSGWPGAGGGDVWMNMRQAGVVPVVVPFEGNTWDHAPPTILVSTDVAADERGIDVFEYAVSDGGGPMQPVNLVDTGSAGPAIPVCPAGRVVGP